MKVTLTIGQFDAMQKKASLLRERLEQQPTHALLSTSSVSFFVADAEVGHVNLNGEGWIQKSSGGSEAVRL
jgi:hypothetical protein